MKFTADFDFLMWPVILLGYKRCALPVNTVPILPCCSGFWQNHLMMKTPMTKKENENRSIRGRPRVSSRVARPNRVVTFITDQELQFLTQVVHEEDRSMASVVHRIIAAHINED